MFKRRNAGWLRMLVCALCVCCVTAAAPWGVIAEQSNDQASMVVGEKGPETVNMSLVSNSTAIQGQIVERDGRYGQLTTISSNRCYYLINVDDKLLYDLPPNTPMEVTVEYFDEGKGSFELDYDSTEPVTYDMATATSQLWKATPVVNLTDTKTWKSFTYHLEDMKLSNRCTGGTDIRLGVKGLILSRGSEADVIFGSVTVRRADYINPIRVEVGSDELGSIFDKDDDIAVSLGTMNKTDRPVNMSLTYKVYDEAEQLLQKSDKTEYSYAPGEEKTLPLEIANPGKYGIYRIDLSFEAYYEGDPGNIYKEDISREFSVAILHEPGEGNPRYGVVTATYYNYYDTTETADKMLQKVGATVTRTQLIWSRIETTKGVRVVPEFITSRAQQEADDGIDFIPVCTIGGGGSSFYSSGGAVPNTDEGIDAFGKYCADVAKALWEHGTHYIEIWNEYDLSNFNPTNEPPETYVKLLKSAYTAVKEVCPDMLVLGMNTYNLQDNNREWFRRCLDAGAYDYLDIVSVHPYDYNGGRNTSFFRDEEYRDKWDKTIELFSQYTNGQPLKPFWITEVGYSTYKDGYSKTSQADASVLLNAITQGYGYADRLLQYDLYDRSYEGERENNWGLIYAWNDNLGNTPRGAKPSFLAMSAFNEFCGKYAVFEEKLEEDRCYAFKYDNSKLGKNVLLLISGHDAEKQKSYNLGCASVDVYDRFGNLLRTVNSDNGIYTFDVTQDPVYAAGNFTTFAESSEKGAVTTDAVVNTATTDDKVSFRFTSSSDKALTIKAESSDRISVAENSGFADGEAELVLATSSSASGDEKVLITVEDESGSVLYCQYHTIRIVEPLIITVKAETATDLGNTHWRARVELENPAHETARAGTVRIVAPDDAAAQTPARRFENLKAGKKTVMMFNLPEKMINSSMNLRLETVVDGAGTYYTDQFIDFTAAAYAERKPKIDGEASQGEWNGIWIGADTREAAQSITDWGGPQDVSFSSVFMWDEEKFYMLAIVNDDVQSSEYQNVGDPAYMWRGDSIQFALDDRDSITSLDRQTFSEFVLGNIPGRGDKIYRSISLYPQQLGIGEVKNADVAIRRYDTYTIYECAVPWSEIFYEGYVPDCPRSMGFAMLANDNDGAGRRGYMTYMSGIAPTKDATLFGKMSFNAK